MKVVHAVIKPFKLDEVKSALVGVGIHGMTIFEVKGFGRQKGHMEIYRGAEYKTDFIPKVKLEMLVPADRVDDVIKVVRDAAMTGKIGDGKVYVTQAEAVLRIRTGETGKEAI